MLAALGLSLALLAACKKREPEELAGATSQPAAAVRQLATHLQNNDLVGFARYELRDQASGAIVARGGKDGFCIADAEPWDVASEQSCERYSCQDQGISRGCSDSYGFVLECQWVDITGVAPGRYTLRVTINADQVIPELDYANDVVEVGLEIGEDSVLVQR